MRIDRSSMLGIGALAAFLVGQGCAAVVDPRPFERLHETAAAFRDGTDETLGAVYDLAAEGFTTPSPFGEEVTFDQLVLTWEEGGDPTRPRQEAEPLHVMIRDMRRGTDELNVAISEYTRFLLLLAGGRAEDAERLEELARTANLEFRSARDGLGLPGDDGEVALVATLGSELLRRKIEGDRRNYLRETMREAQPTVRTFGDFMVASMDLLAGDVTTAYLRWVESRRRAHDDAGSDADRREILQELLERNEKTLLLLDVIRTTREGFRKLPQAHAEVLAGLDERESPLAAVRRLQDDAERLKRLKKELETAAQE